MARLNHFAFGLLFLTALARAEGYNPGALSDVARYRTQTQTNPTPSGVCEQLRSTINDNANFTGYNLKIACIKQPGRITLTMPAFNKVSPSAIPEEVMDTWLQTIYQTAHKHGADKINLFLSSKIQDDKGIVLSIQHSPSKSGIYSDWLKLNLAHPKENAPVEKPTTTETGNTTEESEKTKALDEFQPSSVFDKPQTPQKSATNNNPLGDSLPPPPPYQFGK